MSRGAFALMLIALIAVGFFGYSIGRSTAPATVTSHEAVEASRDETPPRARPAAAAPHTETPTLAHALASLPEPEIEPGDGVITGRVTRVSGPPIAGARIVAHRIWLGARGRHAVDHSLEEKVSDLLAQHHNDRGTRRETRTAADGTYRLTGLVPGEHFVRVEHEGYRFSSPTHRVRPGLTADFRGRSVGTIEFTILSPDGTWPEAARVIARRPGGSSTTWTLSPDRREMKLDPGHWTLIAHTLDDALFSEEHEVDLTAGPPAVRLTLHLADGPGIRGQVTHDSDGARNDVHVALQGPGQSGDEDGAVLARVWVHEHEGFKYSFPNLEPGTYRLRVEHADRKRPPVTVVVGSRMVEQDLVVAAPAPETVVLVRVLGPDGKDLATAHLAAGYRSKTGSSSGSWAQDRTTDGRWRLPHAEVTNPDAHEDLVHHVRVQSREYGTRIIEYVPGKDREITVQFEAPARLRVIVVGFAGSDFRGQAFVGLSRDEDDAPGTIVSIRDRAKAAVSFNPVPPGSYVIHLHVRPDGGPEQRVRRLPVELPAGESEVEVALPTLHSFVVTVAADRSDDRFWLRDESGLRKTTTHEPANGRVVIDALPAGTYIMKSVRDGGRMTIRIPGPAVVRFDPRIPDAILVTLTEPDGHAARSGLRDGDLILRVNDQDTVSSRQFHSLLYSGLEVRLLVRRGTQQVEVVLDTKPVADRKVKPGARFEGAFR